MLVLSRRPKEKILFPALGVTIEIASVARNVVRVGIDAPPSISIVRDEIASESDRLAATESKTSNHRQRNRLHIAALAVHLAQKQLQAGFAKEAEATLGEALCEYARLDEELSGESKKSLPAKREIRTLLVEDDANESALLAEFLRLHGIEVEIANDGQDALDYLRSHDRPDVILLDMRMPRCDGPATLAAIRGDAQYENTKVFAVSGADPQECPFPSGSRGVDGWFRKPVNPSKLIDKMNAVLGLN
ncbi:MAG TPA: response regulator [Gemmataceae bacterium]|jgi:carbon storage regulator CsrA|nr:response regulator [Gemmataceae bacterium]